jgi:CHASE2 domain-containing sensor protein
MSFRHATGIVIIATLVFWLIGVTLGNRAWRNNRQVVGLIGFILAMIGLVEIMIVLFVAYIF